MIPTKVKITRNHVETWDRHWSPGTLGHYRLGSVLAANVVGMACGFMNEHFVEFDAATPALNRVKTIPASLVGTLGTPLSYVIDSKSLVMTAGSVTAAGVPATTGIIPYSPLSPKTRGLLALTLGDVDDKSMITLNQENLEWLAMNKRQCWEVNYDVAHITNSDITNGAAQLGVSLDGADGDPANALGTRFAVFQISDSRISFVDESGTIRSTALPTGPFSLTLRYDSSRHNIDAYIDGVFFAASDCNAAFTVAGIAARIYHTAAYTALADAPLAVYLDGVSAYNFYQLGD